MLEQMTLFAEPRRDWAREQRRGKPVGRVARDGRGRNENSLAAHADNEEKLSRRAMEILAWLVVDGRCLSDREIRDGYAPGQDMDYVRPRITELTDAGLLETVDKIFDAATGARVRRSRPTAAGVAQISADKGMQS